MRFLRIQGSTFKSGRIKFQYSQFSRSFSNEVILKSEILDKLNNIPKIHPLLLERVELMKAEHKELEDKISNGHFDQDLNTKFSKVSIILEIYQKYLTNSTGFEELKSMIDDDEIDQELLEEAHNEIESTLPALKKNISTLQSRLLPPIKYSEKPTLFELRPGAGGSEASLFTEDLFQMYINFANVNRWKYTLISKSESSSGFVNEIIFTIDSENSFDVLRHESGVHRVQRVPSTEGKGRIHTSTAAVVVLPKMSEGNESSLSEDERSFAPGEIRIDTFRAGGKGGQHVNTTDSAVRIVHYPSGIEVNIQDERSQPKNKAKAFSVLRSRLAAMEREKEIALQKKMRSDQVTSTDRSDKVRTYNYPQNRVTDHRAQYSLHDLEGCMDGSRLLEIIEEVEEAEFESRIQYLINESKTEEK